MDMTTPQEQVDALVIFGATGDLAKLETFPALVGLVDRGVLSVPVIGVAKSGWNLSQFRDYARDSLKLNKMDPESTAAVKMLGLLAYVDGDLADPATYQAMSDAIGTGHKVLYYLEVPPPLFGRIAEGISKAGPARGGHGGKAVRHQPAQRAAAQRADAPVLQRGRHLPGGPLAGPGPGGQPDVPAVRELDPGAAAQPDACAEHPDHHGRGVRRRRPRQLLRQDRRDPGRRPEPHAPGAGHGAGRPAGRRRPGLLARLQVADHRGAGAAGRQHDRPGPVRGLPRRGRRRPQEHDGDLRGAPDQAGLVALGRG